MDKLFECKSCSNYDYYFNWMKIMFKKVWVVRILVVWLDIGNCLLIDSVVYWLFIIVIFGFC